MSSKLYLYFEDFTEILFRTGKLWHQWRFPIPNWTLPPTIDCHFHWLQCKALSPSSNSPFLPRKWIEISLTAERKPDCLPFWSLPFHCSTHVPVISESFEPNTDTISLFCLTSSTYSQPLCDHWFSPTFLSRSLTPRVISLSSLLSTPFFVPQNARNVRITPTFLTIIYWFLRVFLMFYKVWAMWLRADHFQSNYFIQYLHVFTQLAHTIACYRTYQFALFVQWVDHRLLDTNLLHSRDRSMVQVSPFRTVSRYSDRLEST